jgi:hypothetical protein
MVENTDQAIAKGVNQPKWKWSITVYIYGRQRKGAHEWMIEFKILLLMYHNSRKH